MTASGDRSLLNTHALSHEAKHSDGRHEEDEVVELGDISVCAPACPHRMYIPRSVRMRSPPPLCELQQTAAED